MSSMPLLWPAIVLACFAGLVRGYCGFGFAMLMALGLMLFLPPLEAVPLALLLDLVTSVGLWRRACRLAAWPRLRRLLLGMLGRDRRRREPDHLHPGFAHADFDRPVGTGGGIGAAVAS